MAARDEYERMDLVVRLGAYFDGCSRAKSTPRISAPGYLLYVDYQQLFTAPEVDSFMFEVGCSLSHINRPNPGPRSQIQDSGVSFERSCKRDRMKPVLPGNREEFVEKVHAIFFCLHSSH